MLGFTSTWKSHLKTRDEFSRFPGWVDIAPTLYKFHWLVCGSHCGTVALTVVRSPAAPRNRGHHSSEHGPCRWDCCKRSLAPAPCVLFYKPPPREPPTASQLRLLEQHPSTSAKEFSRCADEECILHSCSPVMPPPGHKMENDIRTAGLKSD